VAVVAASGDEAVAPFAVVPYPMGCEEPSTIVAGSRICWWRKRTSQWIRVSTLGIPWSGGPPAVHATRSTQKRPQVRAG